MTKQHKKRSKMKKEASWNWREKLSDKHKGRRRPFPTLAEMEVEHIAAVLAAYDYNMAHAARALGISRSKLYRVVGNGDIPMAIEKSIQRERTAKQCQNKTSGLICPLVSRCMVGSKQVLELILSVLRRCDGHRLRCAFKTAR